MPKRSAGLLVYRRRRGEPEVFLVHPGGPFWVKKDLGAWSIPKGEPAPGEDGLAAARREFIEETGQTVDGEFAKLPSCRLPSGKTVVAWAVEGKVDETAIASNTCTIEWPPRSGKRIEIPEIDRGGWFSLAEAKRKINKSQTPLLEALARSLKASA
ncbi:MAG: NUDIX domain-containing protein [Alphaproteobacteria bacterium]|nr:NUDIX domain-containing protein [Alphaproteobacteria bacterium]